jgi:hypothetical protein
MDHITNSPSETNSQGEPGVLAGLQHKVTSGLDNEKNRAAEGINSIADVIRRTGNELRPTNESLATLVESTGDQIRRFADGIRQRGTHELMNDVADFGRRQPALFIGSAFIVGLGLARFLKASSVKEGSGHGERFASLNSSPPFSGGQS